MLATSSEQTGRLYLKVSYTLPVAINVTPTILCYESLIFLLQCLLLFFRTVLSLFVLLDEMSMQSPEVTLFEISDNLPLLRCHHLQSRKFCKCKHQDKHISGYYNQKGKREVFR